MAKPCRKRACEELLRQADSQSLRVAWQHRRPNTLGPATLLTSYGRKINGISCGRNNQRYAENGDRLVAGVVALNKEKTYVLLIESSRRTGWVIPKGGWETDEDCMEAAKREAWEEAGILCNIDYDLGKITETRSPKQISKNAPKALYQFFEVTVTKEEIDWPEKGKRDRRWFTYADAAEELKHRPELAEALRRSTLKR